MAIFGKAKLREIFEQAEIEVSKDVLNRICDLHTDSLDGLNDTVKDLKESLATAERERDDYKAKAPKDGVETVSKEDYDKLKKEYDDYKADMDSKEVLRAKQTAYRELAKAAELTDRGIEKAVKYAKWDEIELDKDGKIKEAEKHTEFLKSEWSEHHETTTTKGADTATPPTNNGGTKMTKAEIYKKDDKGRYVLSTEERQKALVENKIQ